MTDDTCKYLLDTDFLVHIQNRADAAVLYDGIAKLAAAGVVRTVRQVFDELKRFEQPFAILSPHRAGFVLAAEVQYCEEVSDLMDKLGDGGFLWEQTGGKNPDPADPWLVGVASHRGYTLVTDERQKSKKRIPAACRFTGARCITGPHFLHEVGIVTEFKPEHIDPDAFFSKG